MTPQIYPRDLTGLKFGRLTVRKASKKRDAQGNILWLCDCQCGGIKYASRVHLRRGQVISCGCAQAEQKSLAMSHHRETQEQLKAVLEENQELRQEIQSIRSKGGFGDQERQKLLDQIRDLESELGWHQVTL
jgi:hypothetical protein